MASYSISTTAEFDAGTKNDPGDGNYGVETNTNNPAIPADQIEPANMRGDRFDKLDADFDTFKWNKDNIFGLDLGTIVRDINSTTAGMGYIKGTTNGGRGVGYANISSQLSGTFDVRMRMRAASISEPGEGTRFRVHYDNDNYSQLLLTWQNTLNCRNRVGGVSNETNVSTSDKDIFVRIKRDSSNVIYLYYNLSSVGDITSDSGWTLARSDAGFSNDIYVALQIYASTGVGDWNSMETDDFYCADATFVSTAYRTTCNWKSPSEAMPGGEVLDEFTVNYSEVSATYTVTPKILRASDDAVLWTGSAITSGTSETYTDADFGTIDVNFKWQFDFAGDGANGAIITEITGETVEAPAGGAFVPRSKGILMLLTTDILLIPSKLSSIIKLFKYRRMER